MKQKKSNIIYTEQYLLKNHFSAGDWFKDAKKIDHCLKKKKIPIIVGGTGLYFNTITKGISKIPNIDLKTRSKVRDTI